VLVRSGGQTCALPVRAVIEVMRPLPVRPVAGAPAFVRGAALVRGAPAPVVDLAAVLGLDSSTPSRFVSIRVGERALVLAVDAVLGVRRLPRDTLAVLPPLLAGAETVAALGVLDADLLLVLREAALVPDELWSALTQDSSSP